MDSLSEKKAFRRRHGRALRRASRRLARQKLQGVRGPMNEDSVELMEEELAVVRRKGWRKRPAVPLRVHVRWLLERRRRLGMLKRGGNDDARAGAQ